MTFYSQKDTKVKIGNENIYCTNASIAYNVDVTPKLEVGHKNAFEYSPSSPPKGTINLNYYLTGKDPIAQNLSTPTSPISFDMGGLSVASGYLSKYAIQVEPYSPAQVTASFSFYQKVNGEFTATASELPTGLPLFISDLSLDNEIKIGEEKIQSLSYNATTNLTPTYTIENEIDYDGSAAKGVASGPTKIDLSFSLNLKK